MNEFAGMFRFARAAARTTLPALMAAALGAFATGCCAEDGTPKPPAKAAEVVSTPPVKPAPVAGDEGEKRSDDQIKPGDSRSDPTQPSERMKRALTRNTPTKVEAHVPEPQKIPEMALRGLVKAADKSATAMIDIGGKSYANVKEDSSISVKQADGRTITIKVLKISTEAVEVEVVELKTHVTLH